MSINHYSSDIPETLWWTQQQQAILMEPIQNSSTSGPPINPSWPSQLYHHQPSWLGSHTPRDPPGSSMYSTTNRFNLNQDEEEEGDDNGQPLLNDQATSCSRSGEGEDEKEPMFEKPLTPSDVGKLNRLVIPKQHAEKYFPLGAGADSGENKGLLLSFEDESGKGWRFRYSYWNSSQSYVLTKGWSRYVKEKRLDAGDIVLFERHRADAQRLYIRWRRRQQQHGGSAPAQVSRAMAVASGQSDGNSNSNNNNGVGCGGVGMGVGVGVGWTRGFYAAHPYPTHQPLPYQPECLHAVSGRGPQGQKQTMPVGNNSKVLRLFGVNMECQSEPDESGPSTPECSSMSSTHHHFHPHQTSYSSNPHHHMDVNQMRNGPG